MRANFDRLIDGASEAASLAGEAHVGQTGDTLAIAISCVGRRLVLGERVEEEIEATFDELPAGTRQIGFYSYGEISPYAKGPCDLHNQTMTMTTIRESASAAEPSSTLKAHYTVPTMHSLLARQLKKTGLTHLDSGPTREAWLALLDRFNQSYSEADQERYLLECSLNISWREMQELSGSLSAERDRLTAILHFQGDGLCANGQRIHNHQSRRRSKRASDRAPSTRDPERIPEGDRHPATVRQSRRARRCSGPLLHEGRLMGSLSVNTYDPARKVC